MTPLVRSSLSIYLFVIFIIFTTCRILPKSVRWLLSKQKVEEGQAVIKQIASVNGVTLKSQHLDIEIRDKEFKEVGFVKTLLELFRHRTLAIRSCIVFLNW